MTSRLAIATELDLAREELTRLRRDLAEARDTGNRDFARALAVQVNGAALDVERLEGELRAFDEHERSAERRAVRAQGRTAAKRAAGLAGELAEGYEAFDRSLQALVEQAASLARLGEEAQRAMIAAIKADSGTDTARLTSRASTLIPPTAGADHAVALAIAQRIVQLIKAMPCATIISTRYLDVSSIALSVGRVTGAPSDPPGLPAAAKAAAEYVARAAADLCAEPTELTKEAA